MLARGQPPGAAIVGQHQVKGAVGAGVEVSQRHRGRARVGMVQRVEHQLAAGALARRRAQRAGAVQDRGDDTVVVAGQPASPRFEIDAADHLVAVRPVTGRRFPEPSGHLVAVGGQQERPVMPGPAQDYERAHVRCLA
jgi:hypothetical protein